MSSRANANAIVLALNVGAALGAGLLLSGIGLYAYKKLSNRPKKYNVVFVVGGPGSGKGTNCSKIVEQFPYVHLSAGDLLREEREKQTELSELINSHLKEGKIVPAEITVRLLKAAMEKAYIENNSTKFLIDGFPRDMQNFECWNKEMGREAEIQFILFLDCPNDVMIGRLLERGRENGKNHDKLETITKRMSTYEQSTRPIIDYFRGLGKVREVDTNRPIKDIFEEVQVHFSNAQHSSV